MQFCPEDGHAALHELFHRPRRADALNLDLRAPHLSLLPVHGGKYARTVICRMRAAFDFSAPPASDGTCPGLQLRALALDAHNVAEDDKIARFVFAERESRAADQKALSPAADDDLRLRECGEPVHVLKIRALPAHDGIAKAQGVRPERRADLPHKLHTGIICIFPAFYDKARRAAFCRAARTM